jgi:hypothetical protein
MNVLDENILQDQRQLLSNWQIPFRQIGYELGRKGMKDDEIIPFLLTLHEPTLFTLDGDFYKRGLCHARYGLVYLDVKQSEAATFIRFILRHPTLKTHASRMGTTVRASHTGLTIWQLHSEVEMHYNWAS